MSDEPKKLQMRCDKCDITKEVLLIEKNMCSKDLGIWPFFTFPHTYCSRCNGLVEVTFKE